MSRSSFAEEQLLHGFAARAIADRAKQGYSSVEIMLPPGCTHEHAVQVAYSLREHGYTAKVSVQADRVAVSIAWRDIEQS